MGQYVLLLRWTDTGIKNVKDTIKRAESFRKYLEKKGGKLTTIFYTFGKYDIVVTAELPAINAGGLKRVQELLAPIAPYVDAVNATDNPAAHAHASNVAIAIAVLQSGSEPIMQVVCRDKNRLAIQADIVGAALFGVENICALTGDDVTAGDEPEARRVLTVSQLTARIRTLLEEQFFEVWVEGELSNCRVWTSGHMYFTLKDRNSQIKGVMFGSSLRLLRFAPADGLRVVARGRVSV